jgi:rhodanese-related sulfurtransferase
LEFIQQNLSTIALAVCSGIALLVLTIRRPGDRNALSSTQATFLINRENALVIDVREADVYADGHLPEARNFPAARLGERVGEIDKFKDTPLVVVCQSGVSSANACKQLAKLGFTRVHSLDGGINAWRAAGLPLKKGSKK